MPAIASSVENVTYNSPDGANIGRGPLEKVAFYGVTPAVQRPYTGTLHATTALAASASFGATQTAVVQEIMNTLIGLGVWATS